MDPFALARAAADVGWRRKVADVVAPRIHDSKLPLRDEHARALLGFVFLALTARTLVATVRRARGS
jgi:hypothetical protein